MKSKLLLPLLSALVLAGCNSGTDNSSGTTTAGTTGTTAANSGGKLQIAVVPKGATHEYWKSIHAGAQRAADELKDVEILWKGPVKEDDRDSQIDVVQNFITKKVSGIVLAPLDDKALAKPIKEAQDAGIPVVVIDSGVTGVTPKSFVATDNRKAGQMAGEELGRILNGKGRIAMLRYQEGSASTMEREEGFLEGIKKYPGIQAVSVNQYGGATAESAQTASENLIAANGGANLKLDGIYCCNESTTFGMLRALQNAKLAGKVKFVGFDSSDQLVQGLKDGQINALIVQNPEKMGYLGVKTLVDSIRGGKFEEHIDTGATVVTPQNMTTPDVAKLLAPPKI